MKKLIAVALALFVAAGAAFAQVDLSKVKDGTYFAESAKYSSSGWKEQVVVKVAGGKIASAQWNGVSNIAGALDKKSHAASGKYGMAKASKIKAEWDKQAAAAEEYLVKTQDVNFAKFDKSGKTDAITGATMTVSEFYELVKEALTSAPIAKGPYAKDGWFFAQAAAFDNSGWKDSSLVTVVNGTIVGVVWNGTYKDATKKSKIVESVTGKYGMEKAAKQGAWHLQAEKLEAAILKAGDPSKITLKADGKPDAVSGVSITATLVSLTAEALKAAR